MAKLSIITTFPSQNIPSMKEMVIINCFRDQLCIKLKLSIRASTYSANLTHTHKPRIPTPTYCRKEEIINLSCVVMLWMFAQNVHINVFG